MNDKILVIAAILITNTLMILVQGVQIRTLKERQDRILRGALGIIDDWYGKNLKKDKPKDE